MAIETLSMSCSNIKVFFATPIGQEVDFVLFKQMLPTQKIRKADGTATHYFSFTFYKFGD